MLLHCTVFPTPHHTTPRQPHTQEAYGRQLKSLAKERKESLTAKAKVEADVNEATAALESGEEQRGGGVWGGGRGGKDSVVCCWFVAWLQRLPCC